MNLSLNGKKKWSAVMVSLLTSMVGGLVSSGTIGSETAEPLTVIITTVLPLILGGTYTVAQGVQDKKKEEVKIEEKKVEEANAFVNETLYNEIKELRSKVDLLESVPFDVDRADKESRSRALKFDFNDDPFNIYKGARAYLSVTPVKNLDQLQDATDWIVSKIKTAYKDKFGEEYEDMIVKEKFQTEKDCYVYDYDTYLYVMGTDYVALNGHITELIEAQKWVNKLKPTMVRWWQNWKYLALILSAKECYVSGEVGLQKPAFQGGEG